MSLQEDFLEFVSFLRSLTVMKSGIYSITDDKGRERVKQNLTSKLEQWRKKYGNDDLPENALEEDNTIMRLLLKKVDHFNDIFDVVYIQGILKKLSGGKELHEIMWDKELILKLKAKLERDENFFKDSINKSNKLKNRKEDHGLLEMKFFLDLTKRTISYLDWCKWNYEMNEKYKSLK